ncbi:hypothetical protein [uncultured Pelagimonas sp.]|uniref:hypothetical protein n=1 Tax=uncultured Pelagimonas sp. TaxID=1618102 RepID=UPI00260F4497|nr:hypothetical protein [uncultured Pelagimonas sp.]
MIDRIAVFGSDAPTVVGQVYSCGPLSFCYENGALRHVSLYGNEAIRSIAFLVRDRDWGTLPPYITNEEILCTPDSVQITYAARFSSNNAQLDVDITILADTRGLKVVAKGVTIGAFETNRAGFTVLHPIQGVAGHPVQVSHSDGSVETTHFPDLIAPWQPFMDIVGLTHQAGNQKVTCQFSGDTFEMEDQRQWGDASFKTYNRPLARPWPYEISDLDTLDQSVVLSWTPTSAYAPPRPEPTKTRGGFPEMALVISPDEAVRLAANPGDIENVRPQRLLCHLDASLGNTQKQFEAFAKAQRACPNVTYDLELICLSADDPRPEMIGLAQQMQATEFAPSSVLVCPSVDRQSTPPGSEWPPCPPLERIHAAARLAFGDIKCGGGMVSFFPELNRKRPPVEMLDFVGHGLCPIVHAADDTSVMETLETIPHITKSARAIIGDRPYRIGPSTLAMRQNPYGEKTIENPHQTRICMAHDDPRHRGEFGAAYTIGLAAALAPAGIEVWTPGALYGPRGVISRSGPWPLTLALKELAAFAGQPVHSANCASGMASIRVGTAEIRANLTPQTQGPLGPYDWHIFH